MQSVDGSKMSFIQLVNMRMEIDDSGVVDQAENNREVTGWVCVCVCGEKCFGATEPHARSQK